MDRGRYLFFLKIYEDFDHFFLAKATLSADDIDYLKKNTRYDEQEIKEWYRCAEYLNLLSLTKPDETCYSPLLCYLCNSLV